MKTVNQDFLDAQAKHRIRYYKEVNIYRRSWDAGTVQYVWEVTPYNIGRYVRQVGSLSWSLDTEAVNVWRSSNIAIVVKNAHSEFESTNTAGIFFGYEMYMTKLEIKVGYYKADGTTVTTYVYTGFIYQDPVYNYDNDTVVLNVGGKDILLSNADAMNVSTTVTNEVIGTGDGTASQIFVTAHSAVAKIRDSKVNGVAQYQGVDYAVSNLNGATTPGQLTYNPAPPLGLQVTASYDYWYTNISIATIVGYLLDEAGFDSSNRTVDAGIFYSGQKSSTWNTKTDLENSVRSRNIDTTSLPGDMIHLTEDFTALTLSGLAIDSGALIVPTWYSQYECNDLPESATPAWTKTGPYAFGTREINPAGIFHLHKNASISGAFIHADEIETRTGFSPMTCAFRLKMTQSTVAYDTLFNVVLDNGSKRGSVSIGALSISDGNYHDFWVFIDIALNKIRWYMDGVEQTQNTLSASSNPGISFEAYAVEFNDGTDHRFSSDFYLDYMYYSLSAFAPTTGPTGTGTSTSLNYWAAASWGTIYKSETLNSGTILYETQSSTTSDFSSGNDAWSTVTWAGNVGTIHSAQLKYLRWRCTITPNGAISPRVSEVTMPASALFVAVDCSTDLQAYVNYDSWYDLNGQTLRLFSLTSADSSTFDAEQIITAGAITSTVRRFIKFRNEMSKTAAGTLINIHRNKFIYAIKSFTCAMAGFDNKSVQNAIEEIARILDYEIGVDSQGKYFFRSKTAAGALAWTFQEGKDLITKPSVRPGWERVQNAITSQYGSFTATSDQFLALDAQPNSQDKWGIRFLRMGESSVAVASDVNISIGMAQTYFTNHKDPKRVVTFRSKVIPQLDLSDKIQVSSSGLTGVNLKVVGITLDIDNWTMDVTAWEI